MNIEADARKSVSISGILFQAFVNAGESLKLLLWGRTDNAETFAPDIWYSLDEFVKLLELTTRYKNPHIILEQMGSEMTKFWYHHGPGRDAIHSSIDFIRHQTGANGFQSVIKGPQDIIGRFELKDLDEERGFARIQSSTVFPRGMEQGILYGGLGLIEDLLYYEITFDPDTDCFDIFFVTENNRMTTANYSGELLGIPEWRMKHLVNQSRRKEIYWQSINETLNMAFLEMKEAMDKVKVLRGLLPICSSCKKIRDDKGYWTQLEYYISKHSEADFSHGLCPECIRRLYPDINLDDV